MRGVFISCPAFASTHCAYPRRDDQADITWMAGYVLQWCSFSQIVITSIDTNTLALYDTAAAAADTVDTVNN